jgi:phage tail protein X
MKKINIGFISLFLLCFSLSLSAQSVANSPNSKDTIKQKITYKSTLFSDNFSIEAAAGTQLLFSKDAEQLDFTNRFTPAFSLGIGKWFSPFWGAGVEVQGFSLNGFSTLNGIYLADPQSGSIYGTNDPVRNFVIIRPDGSYRYFLHYLNASFHFQLSLLSLLKGYQEDRRIDFIPAFGLGYMHVFNYKGVPNTNSISTNLELMGKYRMNDKFDINLKFQSSFLPDHFDGRIAGNKYEYYSSASLGLTYHFKNRGFEKFSCPPNIPIIKIEREVDTLYQVVSKIDTVYKEIHQVDTIQIISVRDISSNPERQRERSNEALPADKVKTEKYSVKEGERLYSIARHYYKDPSVWPLIYRANQNSISNPEFLPAGIEIELPNLEGSVGNLSAKDRRDIARGYIEVYLFYKNRDKDEALHHLYVGKKFDVKVLDEYANQIDGGDIEQSDKFKHAKH